MQRRSFLQTAAAFCAVGNLDGDQPSALAEEHFPSRLHQFVWRNWELANLDRMASVVGTTVEQLRDIGMSMGLPSKPLLNDDYLRRIYITVIRQNWHLLPELQIIQLLGWNESRYRFTLKEDDFLDVKLGPKPLCETLRYTPPGSAERSRAAGIRSLLRKHLGTERTATGEPRFAFVRELSTPATGSLRDAGARPDAAEIDLTHGWTIEAATAQSRAAADTLRAFLTERLGVQFDGRRQIRLAVESAAGRPLEWSIKASPNSISLTGNSPEALQRSVYEVRNQMELRGGPFLRTGDRNRREVWSPRYLYSYFALYGDPLMEGDAAGLPDAYLERAAMAGATGVWIQAVLNTLAPSKTFPEFGDGWQTRLRNLRTLVDRASKSGMKIYLYLNEPRAMPDDFFRSRPDMRGSRHQELFALCTSNQQVRDWLRTSISHVFQEVPGLGGLFSITMSENHTNCFSHGGAWGDRYPSVKDCPRCSRRRPEEVLAELIACFRDGVRAHSQAADIISYDWGWGTPLAEALIPKLPADTAVLSISEWSQPVRRGGVSTVVGEYSMSVVGPGPRATHNWDLAKKTKLATLAKTQFNNTWEISAVPWIPVMPLVLEHCKGLAAAGVDGLMPSWTCGGYPSANLRAAAAYAVEPRPDDAVILRQEAEQTFGAAAASLAVDAWKAFSEAFREFPYGVAIYIIPTQHGPANLLRLSPTNLKPGMILFPHDAYKAWSGGYPPNVVRSQFRAMVAKWGQGLTKLEQAVAKTPASRNRLARRELAIAQTCQNHFQSTANQIEFYLLRDSQQTVQTKQRMLELIEDEIALSRSQYSVAKSESLIGYEASNHYYYTPLDLAEKILNCDWIARQLQGTN